MFGLGKKKTTDTTKTFKVAEKIIKGAEKTGALNVMQQAFIAGLPQTYSVLINKVQKKFDGRVPTFAECNESLHKNPDFFKAAKMMGFEEPQLVDMLESQYNKMFGH